MCPESTTISTGQHAPKLRTFASRLKWVRQRYDLSLEDFGYRLGVGRSYLSKLENGKRKNPSKFLLLSLNRVYRVRPDWIVKGHGNAFDFEPFNQAIEALPAPAVKEHSDAQSARINALTVTGMVLSLNPSPLQLSISIGSGLNELLHYLSDTGKVQLNITNFLLAELKAQLSHLSNSDPELNSPMQSPLSEDGKFALDLHRALIQHDKLKKEKIPVK